MRKIFVFFAVILILTLSVVPAFADSSDHILYYPVLNFDSVYGSEFHIDFIWPFNSFELGMNDAAFSLYDSLFYGSVSTTDSTSSAVMNGSFTTPTVAGSNGAVTTLTLSKVNPQVVPRGYLGSANSYEIFTSASDLLISSVRLSGWVRTIESQSVSGSSDEEYSLVLYGFDQTFECSDNVARIGNWLNDCLNDISEIDGQYYVLLEQLVVEINVSRQSVATPTFYISSHLSPNVRDLVQWSSQYDLKKDVVNIDGGSATFDVTTWLSGTVGSFLDLEFAPGLSINKILYVILVVGVLLWFVKIIS